MEPSSCKSAPRFRFLFICLFGAVCFSSSADAMQTKYDRRDVRQKSSIEKLLLKSADFSTAEWSFIVGYAAFKKGECQEAVHRLAALDEKFIAYDYVLFVRAACAFEAGHFAAVEESVEYLLHGYADSAWIKEGKLLAAKGALSSDRYQEALHKLDGYTRESLSLREQREAELLRLKLFIVSQRTGEAEALSRRLLLSSRSQLERGELFALVSSLTSSFSAPLKAWSEEPSQQISLARAFEESSHWSDAVAILKPLSHSDALVGSLRAEAMSILGRSLARLHHYQEAIKILEDVRRMPESIPFREELIQRLALIYAKDRNYERAIELLGELNGGRGHIRVAAQRASLLYDLGRYREALAEWRTIIAKVKRGDYAEDARWWIAWTHFKLGEHTHALSTFDRFLKGHAKRDRERRRALYWKGRTLEHLNHDEEARACYREILEKNGVPGYYHFLATRRLKGSSLDFSLFALPPYRKSQKSRLDPFPPFFAAEWRAPLKSHPHLQRALFFDRLGLGEEVGRELAALPPGNGASPEFILWLAAKHELYDLAYRLAWTQFKHYLSFDDVTGDSMAALVWRGAYPEAYRGIVQKALRGSELQPELIYAIMSTESNFRPRIVSPAGAIGLMQLMPTTASLLAREQGDERFDSHDLFLPPINVAYGIVYLKKLAKLFPENPIAWIASYNAGEEAVSRWLATRDGGDREAFIEEIPYRETNLYVKKVLANFWMQRLLSNDTSASNGDGSLLGTVPRGQAPSGSVPIEEH